MHSRHDLAWLSAAGWEAAIVDANDADTGMLTRWRSMDWPLVVTRRAPDAALDSVCLGLAAPPEGGLKQRIALRAPAAAITRTEKAMLLDAAIGGAPVTWLAALTSLRDHSRGLDLRVFGSLAMQTITRQPYLSASSDIDLLFQPASRSELRDGVALLAAHAARLPLDGEIVFPDGAAVAWKEWLKALEQRARVLVKDTGAVRLASADSLLATLKV